MQYMVICITLFCSRFRSNDGAAQPCAAAGGVCVLAAASGTECSWFRGIWRCLGFIGFEMKVYDVTRVFGLAMIPCFYYFGVSATTEECKFSAPLTHGNIFSQKQRSIMQPMPRCNRAQGKCHAPLVCARCWCHVSHAKKSADTKSKHCWCP